MGFRFSHPLIRAALSLALVLEALGSGAAAQDASADSTEDAPSEAERTDTEGASAEDDAEDDDWLDALDEDEGSDREGEEGEEDWLDALDDEGEDDEWDFSEADEAAEEDANFWKRLTVTVTSTTVAQYRFDNFNARTDDDEYLSVWERLEAAIQADDLRLSARLDGFLAAFNDSCPEVLEASDCFQNDLRLERFSAHWEYKGLTLDAVDSYAVLGRGIALSLRRVDILGIDTSLRGGQVAYDDHGVFVRVLGGNANPQNLDPQTLTIRSAPEDQLRRGVFSDPETRDWIIGGEIGVRLGPDDDVEVGIHGQRVYFARNETAERRTTVDIGGWHLSAPALADGAIALYGEMNLLQRSRENDLLEDTQTTGYAIYATAQLVLDQLSVLLEWKDYSDYIVAETNQTGEAHRIYSAAPTLERDEERPRALYNARGGRLQVDYGFAPGPWSLSLNALAYAHAEDASVDPFDGILVTHGYARVQKVIEDDHDPEDLAYTFELIGGYRRESYIESPFPDLNQWDLDWQVWHAQLDFGVVIGKHSLELTVIHRDERLRNFTLVDYVRGTASLTYSWAGRIRVAPVLNWNTEQANNPSLYPGLEARFDFLEGSFVRVFGGRTPGGRICSGGVCRDVPPFEGFLTELVLRI